MNLAQLVLANSHCICLFVCFFDFGFGGHTHGGTQSSLTPSSVFRFTPLRTLGHLVGINSKSPSAGFPELLSVRHMCIRWCQLLCFSVALAHEDYLFIDIRFRKHGLEPMFFLGNLHWHPPPQCSDPPLCFTIYTLAGPPDPMCFIQEQLPSLWLLRSPFLHP